jgi:hypothetical protein
MTSPIPTGDRLIIPTRIPHFWELLPPGSGGGGKRGSTGPAEGSDYSGGFQEFSYVNKNLLRQDLSAMFPGLAWRSQTDRLIQLFYKKLFTNWDPIFPLQSRSRSKTVPEKSIHDFHSGIDPRFPDQNRIPFFVRKSITDFQIKIAIAIAIKNYSGKIDQRFSFQNRILISMPCPAPSPETPSPHGL